MTDTQAPTQEESREESQSSQDIPREDLLVGIGQRLRQAREQRGLSTDEIARELKLRAAYLGAMEKGDWSTLPGDVYGIGFARQYARHLGLDMEQDIARISSDEYQLTKPLTFPDPPIAPAKRWAVTATLLFILLFIAFNVFHSAVHKHASAPAPEAVQPSPPPPAPKPAPAVTPPASASAPATSPSQRAASDAGDHAQKGAHRYRFEAVGGDVWLQLYSGPDTLVKEALLRQGQHMDIDTDATSLIMDCGNAGAIQISIDGKPSVAAGQLGPVGKVIRDFTLKVPAP